MTMTIIKMTIIVSKIEDVYHMRYYTCAYILWKFFFISTIKILAQNYAYKLVRE